MFARRFWWMTPFVPILLTATVAPAQVITDTVRFADSVFVRGQLPATSCVSTALRATQVAAHRGIPTCRCSASDMSFLPGLGSRASRRDIDGVGYLGGSLRSDPAPQRRWIRRRSRSAHLRQRDGLPQQTLRVRVAFVDDALHLRIDQLICRQRPGTAAGVTFMTLEDETGFVNVVLWKDMFEKNRVIAKTTAFLGVTGRLQVESNVVHLIGEKLWRPKVSRVPRKKSRDFH